MEENERQPLAFLTREPRLKIIGTGSYLPSKVISNKEFADRPLNLYDEQGNLKEKRVLSEKDIAKKCGIAERRWASDGEDVSSMGYESSLRALSNAGMEAKDLDGIIVATTFGSGITPNNASRIQSRLGFRARYALDINVACCGFPVGLMIASDFPPGNYLVVASEVLSRSVDMLDYNSFLFGDGAGAAVLTPAKVWDNGGVLAHYSDSNPLDGRNRYVFSDPNKLRMPHGTKVFREAVTSMGESVSHLAKICGWEKNGLIIVPHQANGRITDQVRDDVNKDLPSHFLRNIVYSNIHRYGNMGGATCIIALDKVRREDPPILVEGSRYILTTFAAGLETAATAVQS